MMEYILPLVLLLGFVPAMIARSKGRSFFGWYVYGVVLFIIALVHSLLLKQDMVAQEEQALAGGGQKRCPFCAELIKKGAVVCRFCGKDLPQEDVLTCPTCQRADGIYQDVYQKLYCSHCQQPVYGPKNGSSLSGGYLNQ